VGIGGNNPIRVQTMTATDTMDTMGTVESISALKQEMSLFTLPHRASTRQRISVIKMTPAADL
jgi:4-hydroxy-3-methylbut-2-en-1-yl diphosphate synthase IspG/GcpE